MFFRANDNESLNVRGKVVSYDTRAQGKKCARNKVLSGSHRDPASFLVNSFYVSLEDPGRIFTTSLKSNLTLDPLRCSKKVHSASLARQKFNFRSLDILFFFS